VTPVVIGDATLYRGDCMAVLPTIASNSIDSVVCDPPYGLSFMGAKWDYDVPSVEVWAECLRVLKPGGYLLAFGGTRTYHRLAIRIEDAGFVMHPMMAWIFGSGFPKATKVKLPGMEDWRYGLQSLKPALEPIAFAQKPFSEKTGTANIARWGTGALNIGGCRVQTDEALSIGAGGLLSHVRDGKPYPNGHIGEVSAESRYSTAGGTDFAMTPGPRGGDPLGRWPANIAHDGSDEVRAALPDSNGQQGDLSKHSTCRQSPNGIFSGMRPALDHAARIEDDKSAARFFYCAKTTRTDRNEGCEGLPDRAAGMNSNTSGQHITRRDDDWSPEPVKNNHPTVKPTDLMAYYVRLVTPPGGTVLDPYMGSGSTGKACVREGMPFIGIDKDEDENGEPLGYLEIATARISHEIKLVANAAAEAQAATELAARQPDLFAESP
jgi:DNA modification methylase